MFRTELIALDHSAAQGPLLDCLSDLRDMGVARVILTHVVKLGYGQGTESGNREALETWLSERAVPLRAARDLIRARIEEMTRQSGPDPA